VGRVKPTVASALQHEQLIRASEKQTKGENPIKVGGDY